MTRVKPSAKATSSKPIKNRDTAGSSSFSAQPSKPAKLTSFLHRLLWLLLYALPAVLFFSYYPVISLGSNSSMNFELSLPLIWLVIFDLLSFIWLILHYCAASPKSVKKRSPLATFAINLPGLSDRRFFLFALFPLYITLSIFWSQNPLRGFLTAGIAWLIFFAVFAIIYVLPLGGTPSRLRHHVLASLLISSVLVCIFCFIQSILDTFVGLPRETTLMCAGCTYRSFGFPHPSGFAIEPQFMGNLLLAPALTAMYLIIQKHSARAGHEPSSLASSRTIEDSEQKESKLSFLSDADSNVLHGKTCEEQAATTEGGPRKDGRPHGMLGRTAYALLCIMAFFLSLTLFFTFSRGAIYAYAIALFVLLIFALRRHTFRWHLIAIPVASFIAALILQGTFAALGPTSETFTSGISKSIHQLSLGIIDLRSLSAAPTESIPASTENTPTESTPTQDSPIPSVENNSPSVENTVQNVENATIDCAKPVQNSTSTVENIQSSVDNSSTSCGNTVQNSPQSVQNSLQTAENSTGVLENSPTFDGYVAESTNIRLGLNSVALQTWLYAPGYPTISVGADCGQPYSELCTRFTPTTILFGVGLGGAGVAMHSAHPDVVTSPKEIVQNEPISLLLETGLVGISLIALALLVAFCPNIFSRRFLDGRAASSASRVSTTPRPASAAASPNAPALQQGITVPFWRHPALPLLLSLVIAYLITLNFFSGLPNALQIYLMPPLLYLIFLHPSTVASPTSP